MSKIIIFVFARTASARLPNKVLFNLGGKPAFVQAIERVAYYFDPDYVGVLCTRNACDDPIEFLARHYNLGCFRGSLTILGRVYEFGVQLGLAEDDWCIPIGADVVLGLTAWMPWAITQAEEQGCDYIFPHRPRGTLARAFSVAVPHPWGVYRRRPEWVIQIDEATGMNVETGRYNYGVEKCLIVNFPPEYLEPWPWGPLTLDLPVQGAVIKEIYRQLYRGVPIDPLDVRDFLLREPYLAQMLPGVDNTSGIIREPEGPVLNAALESLKLNMECIEVTWQGGQR